MTVRFAKEILSHRNFSTATYSAAAVPWLFIGLGNPGEKYRSTRHNVGFDMIDMFAHSQGISINKIHCKSLVGEGIVAGTPVLLAKPQTYMNLSGESAGPLAAYYKLPLNRIIVMIDDMELPCGVLRVQSKGGHGRHKGLGSVIYHFRGNREFGRLRIGIGRPPGQMDPKAFLLQKFNATARERIDTALQEGVVILKDLLAKGYTECATSANAVQKLGFSYEDLHALGFDLPDGDLHGLYWHKKQVRANDDGDEMSESIGQDS